MVGNKDNEQRRNEFMDAAEKLFRENGIVDTTVSSIVNEMNVAKGLFYYYFNSKDDLIEAISDKYAEKFKTMMEGSADPKDYSEKLMQFVDNSVNSFQNLVTKLHVDGDVDLSQIATRSMDEAKETASKTLQELLEEGNRLGELQIKHVKYLSDILISGIANLAEQGEATAEEMKEIIMNLIDREGEK